MARRAKARIHINQHRLRENRKTGSRKPVITVKRGKTNRYGFEAVIRDAEGQEVARVVYRPEKPLSCGAVLWVESELDVEVITELRSQNQRCKVAPQRSTNAVTAGLRKK